MNPVPMQIELRCSTEGCSRPVEPGERECAECGLERDLFFRYARLDPAKGRTKPGDEPAGR